MKANELRIGNWVNNNGEDYQITSATIVSMERGDSTARPIPLTEEWLVRLGFQEESKWTFLTSLPNGRFLKFHLGKVCHTGTDGYGSGDITCVFVHQLQNLYFALTGEELTINQQWQST